MAAGLAPGLSGVYQVNIQLSPNQPPGTMDLTMTTTNYSGSSNVVSISEQ